MTPNQLNRAGECLYGTQWRTELSKALHVADRTVRRWASGEFAMPEGAVDELRALLKARGVDIAALLREM